MLPFHKIQIAAAQVLRQLLIFPFGVKGQSTFAYLPNNRQQSFEQIRFALPAVAKYEETIIGFIILMFKWVKQDMASARFAANGETMRIGLAGIIHWEQVCRRASG